MTTKWSITDRRKHIADLVAKKGLWGVNQIELGELMNVTRQTIAKDIQEVFKTLKPENAAAISHQLMKGLKDSYKVNMDILEKAWKNNEYALVLKAIDSLTRLTNAIKNFTSTETVSTGFKLVIKERNKRDDIDDEEEEDEEEDIKKEVVQAMTG